MTDSERGDARARGYVVGSLQNGCGADCPYPFDAPKLRREWFQGFSEGRVGWNRENGLMPSGVSVQGGRSPAGARTDVPVSLRSGYK